MQYQFKLEKSSNNINKYKVIIYKDNKKIKTLQFGAQGYQDYTQHKDQQRKQRYIQRHQKTEDWNNILTRGFWSRWLLWNKETIQESLDDIINRFNLSQLL